MENYLTMKVKVKSLSRVQLFATLWTVAHQALPSMGFSRQEYWSGLPCPLPGDLPSPGIELESVMSPGWQQVLYHESHLEIKPESPALAGSFFTN